MTKTRTVLTTLGAVVLFLVLGAAVGWLVAGSATEPTDPQTEIVTEDNTTTVAEIPDLETIDNIYPDECDELLSSHNENKELGCVFLDLPINETNTLTIAETSLWDSIWDQDDLTNDPMFRPKIAAPSYQYDCAQQTPYPSDADNTPAETKKAPCPVRNLKAELTSPHTATLTWDRPGYTEPRTRCQPERLTDNSIRYAFVIKNLDTNQILPFRAWNYIVSDKPEVTVHVGDLEEEHAYAVKVAVNSEECNLWSLWEHATVLPQ